MKIFIAILLVLLPLTTAVAHCDSYIIGFRGQNGAFDSAAFNRYVSKRKSCSRVFNHEDIKTAMKFINSHKTPYSLYGFSAGASSVSYIVKHIKRKPSYIITIGAWHTTDVNFNRYDIDYDNFFDASGRNNKSPGIHVKDVPHFKMQQYVNKFFN